MICFDDTIVDEMINIRNLFVGMDIQRNATTNTWMKVTTLQKLMFLTLLFVSDATGKIVTQRLRNEVQKTITAV